MAKLKYTGLGPAEVGRFIKFPAGGDSAPQEIPDKLVEEIRSNIKAWNEKGFELLEDSPVVAERPTRGKKNSAVTDEVN